MKGEYSMKNLKRFLSVFLVAAMLVPSTLPKASAHNQELSTQHMHPFSGTEQLIQDTVEELRQQGETAEEAVVDHKLVETVEESGEKTFNQVKTEIFTRIQNNLSSGKVNVTDLNLSKATMEKVLEAVLSENYLYNAITDVTYSDVGGKVTEVSFTASEGYKSAMGAFDEDVDPDQEKALEDLLDKMPERVKEYLDLIPGLDDVMPFGDASACQRHTVGGSQLLGDLDMNRQINVKDVAAITGAIVSREYNKAADINGDKVVDEKDAAALRQMIVNEEKPGYVDGRQVNFKWAIQTDFTPRDAQGAPLDLVNHPEDQEKIANGGLLYMPNRETGKMEIQAGIMPDVYWGLESVSFVCEECGQTIEMKRNAQDPADPMNQALDQMITRYNVYMDTTKTDPQTGYPVMQNVPITEPQPETSETFILYSQVSVAQFADDSFQMTEQGPVIDPETQQPVGLFIDTNGNNNDNTAETINFYYRMFSAFNADHADYLGVPSQYWTSKNSEADPLAAIKSLCNISLDIPIPPAVMAPLIQMLPQAFMSYVMYYGEMLMDVKEFAKAELDALPKGATTVQKMLVLHDWIAEQTTFDMGAMMNVTGGDPETDPIQMTAFGSLLSSQLTAASKGSEKMYGGCICLGYASAFNLLVQDLIYPEVYKNADGSWKTADEVGMNDRVDFGQVMFYSDTAESSLAGEGFGGGFFNNVHYYNLVRVPEAPKTGGDKDNPRDGDWFFVDVCYDDIFVECMTQYRGEADGSVHHEYFLASPLSMNKLWGKAVDYVSNLHDGVEYKTKVDKDGNPVPYPEDHEMYNPEDPNHPMHVTVRAPHEVAANNTCYQDTWFSGTVSTIQHDGKNWYYMDADNNSFGFLQNVKENEDGNYYLDFSEMAKHDIKTGMHATRADKTKQCKLNARPMSAPDYWEPEKKDEGGLGGMFGKKEQQKFKDDPYDKDLVDFGTGRGVDMTFLPALEEAVKEHYTYTDQYPGLTLCLGLYNGKLYFNVSNKIFTYDLATDTCELVKTYNTVNAASDGRTFTASAYYIDYTGEAETVVTVKDNPLAGLSIQPMYVPQFETVGEGEQQQQRYTGMIEMPMLNVNIGTNYSFTAGFKGEDNAEDMKTLYTAQGTNLNPEFNSVMNRNLPPEKRETNDNKEVLWCANIRDSIPMQQFQPAVGENASCAAQENGHSYVYNAVEKVYICENCLLHARNIIVEHPDFNITLHHDPIKMKNNQGGIGDIIGGGQNKGPEYVDPVNDAREAAMLDGGKVDDKSKQLEGGDIWVEVTPKNPQSNSKLLGVQYVARQGGDPVVSTQQNEDGWYLLQKTKDVGCMQISLITDTQYHVNTTFTPEGTGSASVDKPTADANERVTVTLTPKVGYGIKNVTVTATVNGEQVNVPFQEDDHDANVIYFDMPEGSVNVAVETEKVYNISINNPTLVSATHKRAAEGTRVQLIPAPGYKLKNMTVTNDTTGETIALNEENYFTMPASSVSVVVEVDVSDPEIRPDTRNVTVVNAVITSAGGSDTAQVVPGETVTVEAKLYEGAKFVNWTVDGMTLTDEEKVMNPLTFTMPDHDVTISAVLQTEQTQNASEEQQKKADANVAPNSAADTKADRKNDDTEPETEA